MTNKSSLYMLALTLALGLTLSSVPEVSEAKGYSSRSSSYRSSSRSSSSYRSSSSRAKQQQQKAKPPVNRTVIVQRKVVVYRPTRVTSNYTQLNYYRPQPRPSFFGSNMGWIAFSALGAYMLLSPEEQAAQPAPDTAPLKEVPMQDISKALWADGKFSAEDVAIYNEWKKINGK